MENKGVQQRRRNGIALAMTGFVFVLLFQNCDGGFHYNPNSGSLASLGGGVGSSQFRLTTYNSSGTVIPEGQSFDGGAEYKVVASGDDLSGSTILWQLSANTGSCVLKAGTGPEVRYVTCTKSGTVSVQASAVWPDGSITVLASQRTTGELIVDLCGQSSNVRTVFRIANGTGANPWNATPLVAYVGQTIRICNDDSVPHQLRTTGNPCAAQTAPMNKGQFFDCAIQNLNTQDPATGLIPGIYDNVTGPSATFSVRTFDGAALYADTSMSTGATTSCASCHGAYATSGKPRRTFQQIKSAIATVPAMAVLQNQTLLTDDEIRAIAFALSLL